MHGRGRFLRPAFARKNKRYEARGVLRLDAEFGVETLLQIASISGMLLSCWIIMLRKERNLKTARWSRARRKSSEFENAP